MPYPGHSLEWGKTPSAEMQSMYSTVPADCAIEVRELRILYALGWGFWGGGDCGGAWLYQVFLSNKKNLPKIVCFWGILI